MEWWKEKASLPEAPLSSAKDFSKFRVDIKCSDDCDRERLFDFLNEPAATLKKRPQELKTPSAEVVAKDVAERRIALFGFALQSVLDLVAVNSEAMLAESHRFSLQDFQSVLEKLVSVQKGLASMAVPVVGSLLERAIGARLELRSASIPKEAKEATRSLLLLDPLAKDHWGSVEAVLEKIRAVKEPVVVLKESRPFSRSSGRSSSYRPPGRSFGSRRSGRRGGTGRGQWSESQSPREVSPSAGSSRWSGRPFRGRGYSGGDGKRFDSFSRSK